MKTLILIIIVIIFLLVFIPSKESFYGKPIYPGYLYPGVHNYYKDSYKHGLHGSKRKNHLHFSGYNNFMKEIIPIVDHIIL